MKRILLILHTHMLGYFFPLCYVGLMNYISTSYSSLSHHHFVPHYKQYYNIALSTASFLIILRPLSIVLNSDFSYIACYSSEYYTDITFEQRLFFILKFVEWMDTIFLIDKHKGDLSRISNLHYYHHAIVPTMTYYGISQPGELFVYISNSFAHFLMYGYYAYPRILYPFKNLITFYQYIQHMLMMGIIVYQMLYSCNVFYPMINIIGYMYFFYEYLILITDIITPFFGILSTNTKSAFLFLLNIGYLMTKNDSVYLYSFILLFITSVLHHQKKNNVFLRLIDKTAVYNVIYQGGIRFIMSSERNSLIDICILCNFILDIILHPIGNKLKMFCGDENVKNAEFYHAIMHACASFGHLGIIYQYSLK